MLFDFRNSGWSTIKNCGVLFIATWASGAPVQHGLTGDTPNEPVIPEISGPFEVHVTVRFDDLASGSWQRCFDFGNGAFQENIYLTQETDSNDMLFTIVYDGKQDDLFIPNAIREGITDTFVAGVDKSLNMYLKRNGVLLKSETIASLPPVTTTRSNKLIGESNWGGDKPQKGSILGMKVINLDDSPDPFTEMSLLNLPGQMFGAFTASFYLRLDNLSLSNQRILDVSDGTMSESLLLTLDLANMIFEIRQGGSYSHCIFAHGSAAGEMAFWQIQLDNAGFIQFKKNGLLMGSCSDMSIPNTVFRPNTDFGSSSWDATAEPFDGVLLGYRVDLHAVS